MYKKYHWKRDYHDSRDHYVQKSSAFKLEEPQNLLKSVDLRNHCSTVENQGSLGSCTANALVGALEYLENKSQLNTGSNKTSVDLSRLFVYYNERVIEGTTKEDAGALISDGVKSLRNLGVCTEDVWPYSIQKFAVKPSPAAYQNALTRKIKAYARVSRDNGITGVKQVLSSGYPIVFGFTVFEEFEGDSVAQTGVLNMPQENEQDLGGHAVLMVGYDDSTQRVLVRNSWGNDWGMNGYFTMPYDYITDRNLSSDFWTITK